MYRFTVSHNNKNNLIKITSSRMFPSDVVRGDISTVLHLGSTALCSVPAPRWSWSECKCRRRCLPGWHLQQGGIPGGTFTWGLSKELIVVKLWKVLGCDYWLLYWMIQQGVRLKVVGLKTWIWQNQRFVCFSSFSKPGASIIQNATPLLPIDANGS